MKAVLECTPGLPNVPFVELVQMIWSKAARQENDLQLCMFSSRADSVLQEFGTEQICQVMPASLAFYLYEKKEGQIAEFFLTLLCDKSVPVKNVDGGRYVKLVSESHGHSTEPPFQGDVHFDVF